MKKTKRIQTPVPVLSLPMTGEEVRALPPEQVGELCRALRQELIARVEENGGHLASNLGMVETTVAIHRVFTSPTDHILFDVGHQSYVHKLLTGRSLASLRQPGGLSGFPTPKESIHDPFGTGHSSTAFSAALGFAEADRLQGRDCYTVAVIGDGAFTGGMVHEAMNNCRKGLRLVIILNENEMSISRNIGKFAAAISRMRLSRRYNRTKRRTQRFLVRIPLVGKPLSRGLVAVKRRMKNALFGSNLFENLGFFYIGPVDGNSEALVERALREARERQESVIVHLKTRKGCGYPPALEKPELYHSIPPAGTEKCAPAFHQIMGEALVELAKQDRALVAITAAMGCGTGLDRFAAAYPERYFDVGIAEEHAATFAAGLAADGMKPYFAVYSTFLQRAYDNLLHDISLQCLPVRLLVDRASLSLADGPTHHGIYDVAFLSHIPHFRILAPATFGSLRAMLADSLSATGPMAIRYPNAPEDAAVAKAFYPAEDFAQYGVRFFCPERIRPGAVFVCYGRMAAACLRARALLAEKGIPAAVILLEVLAPYEETAKQVAPYLAPGGAVLFAEEGIRQGGAGMCFLDALSAVAPDPQRRCAIRAILDPAPAVFLPGNPLHTFGLAPEDLAESLYALCRGEEARDKEAGCR